MICFKKCCPEPSRDTLHYLLSEELEGWIGCFEEFIDYTIENKYDYVHDLDMTMEEAVAGLEKFNYVRNYLKENMT